MGKISAGNSLIFERQRRQRLQHHRQNGVEPRQAKPKRAGLCGEPRQQHQRRCGFLRQNHSGSGAGGRHHRIRPPVWRLRVARHHMGWELLRRRRPGLCPIRGTFGFRIAARSKRGHESRVSVEHAAGFHSGCVRTDDHGRASGPTAGQAAGQQA